MNMSFDRSRLVGSRPQTTPTTHRRWGLAIVVPARNEAEHIAACLRSVAISVAAAAPRLHYARILVVADGCTDATVDIARRVLSGTADWSVIECEVRNVARARSLGVENSRLHLPACPPDRTWIANTDADTIVPSDWITQQLFHADGGATALAGVIAIDEFPGLPATARHHFARHYTEQLRCGESHPHVHAANMGIRLDAYDRAGGWGQRARSEDRDLWTRLQQAGAEVVSTTALTVTTSGRSAGRVPGGFADWLRGHVEDCDEHERHRPSKKLAPRNTDHRSIKPGLSEFA